MFVTLKTFFKVTDSRSGFRESGERPPIPGLIQENIKIFVNRAGRKGGNIIEKLSRKAKVKCLGS